jgi:hypothetical protein
VVRRFASSSQAANTSDFSPNLFHFVLIEH